MSSLVSVIIPVFNRFELCNEAIESVASQTYRDWELIVVDDRSTTDLSAVEAKVRSLGGKFISLERNMGPGPARNAGIHASESEWIAFLDSDDLWLPDKLEKQMAWHRDHPDSNISQVREKWLRGGQEVTKREHQMQRGGEIFKESCLRCAIGPSCVMMKSSLWNDYGGFDERFFVCEDYELWLRIAAREKVGLIEEELVLKRAGHRDQLSEMAVAMDRYRVLALMKLLLSSGLDDGQRCTAFSALTEKARRVSTGARKRGNEERGFLYARIAYLREDDLGENLTELFEAALGEMKSSDSGFRA